MNTKTTTLTAFCIIIINSLLLTAQAPYGSAGEHTAVPLGDSEAPFGYYEYLPTVFDNSSSNLYPLVLFYHGSSQQGNGTTDLYSVTQNGPVELIEDNSDYNAIVISPQNSSGIYSADDFLALYNYITLNYPIDINRIYVTGLSFGGGGVWNALKGHYDKIAAAVPICGVEFLNNPSNFMQQTAVWAHHNFDDTVVEVENTISNVNRIANIDNSVMSVYPYGDNNSAANETYSMHFKTDNQTWSAITGVNQPTEKLTFTLYKDGGHDAWTQVYENEEVWDWVFAQSINQLSVDKETLDFKLYPNPTSGSVTISTKNETEKKIEVYSISGKKVYESSFFRELTVDLSAYSSGVYFAKVVANDSIEKSMKIIIN
ncbi:T9SS type A sorting domain-containing protein [Winogradskyella helgolandensis]|uniref:T9SS type A sorting domain-containing protein n=1 Tax=Winogradskyella helgolandensis TaxID=2697010 RepID=UPI0015BF5F0D|nr:T9SS type A sorting domain-containing protein [Winogradskyella helgolandensis]